jgi:hypothetical protein
MFYLILHPQKCDVSAKGSDQKGMTLHFEGMSVVFGG